MEHPAIRYSPFAATPLPPLLRKILKTKSCRKKILAKYCIQGVYRQNLEPQRLTGFWEGVGEPWENAVWQFEGRHGDVPNHTKDTKGQERRARRILPYKQSMGRIGNAVKLRK